MEQTTELIKLCNKLTIQNTSALFFLLQMLVASWISLAHGDYSLGPLLCSS